MKERSSLEYYVLDVFSNKSYQGNPLSVVFTEGMLELADYQNISREFGYSETSFIYYAPGQKALNVRSFTPTGVEVDGAGHNLLGAVCAALLKGLKIFDEQEETARFALMKNVPIPLQVSFDQVHHPMVQMQQRPATLGQTVPIDKIAEALGLANDDLGIDQLVPTVVRTEVAHTMVPLKNGQLLNDCKPDNKLLIEISKGYGFEGFYCFAFADHGQDHIVETRFFNPLIGIDEDAATGTAAGPLIGFLAKHHYVQLNQEYKILQGVKLNQPSLIEVKVRDEDILVGGSSIVTMEGRVYL